MKAGYLHYIDSKVKKKPGLVVLSEDEQQCLQLILGEIRLDLNSMSFNYYWPDMYKQVCAHVSGHDYARMLLVWAARPSPHRDSLFIMLSYIVEGKGLTNFAVVHVLLRITHMYKCVATVV